MKSKKQIDAELKRLLKIVNSKRPVESRIAYVAHEAIRWATLNTTGWMKPSEDVLANSIIATQQVRELRGKLL